MVHGHMAMAIGHMGSCCLKDLTESHHPPFVPQATHDGTDDEEASDELWSRKAGGGA